MSFIDTHSVDLLGTQATTPPSFFFFFSCPMHSLIEVHYEEVPQKMMVRRLVQCAVQVL